MLLKGKNEIGLVKQNLDDTLKRRKFMGVDDYLECVERSNAGKR